MEGWGRIAAGSDPCAIALRPQPLLRREQAAGASFETIVAVSDTAASSMNTTTTCRRTACSGSAPARIMPVMAPGRKTMPIVFLLSMTGTMASRTERRMTLAVH